MQEHLEKVLFHNLKEQYPEVPNQVINDVIGDNEVLSARTRIGLEQLCLMDLEEIVWQYL